jgi:hypothetical protein
MILHPDFTDIVVKNLPSVVRDLLREFGPNLCVAGGFCRDSITARDPKDIDIFATDDAVMKRAIEWFGWNASEYGSKVTANAVTFHPFFNRELADVQFITRVYYDFHEELILSFDFSVCQVEVCFDPQSGRFQGHCSELFWKDIRDEKATYTAPDRDEDPGASILRAFKFSYKGYKISEADVTSMLGRFNSQLYNEPETVAKERSRKAFRSIGYAGKRNPEEGRDDEK